MPSSDQDLSREPTDNCPIMSTRALLTAFNVAVDRNDGFKF